MVITDVCAYRNFGNDPTFIASLDAAKCFDSVWHSGLFYKLQPVLSKVLWRFYLQWYRRLTCVVKVHNVTGHPFAVSRGIRQGSKVSPLFFNVFIRCWMILINVKMALEWAIVLLFMLHMRMI